MYSPENPQNVGRQREFYDVRRVAQPRHLQASTFTYSIGKTSPPKSAQTSDSLLHSSYVRNPSATLSSKNPIPTVQGGKRPVAFRAKVKPLPFKPVPPTEEEANVVPGEDEESSSDESYSSSDYTTSEEDTEAVPLPPSRQSTLRITEFSSSEDDEDTKDTLRQQQLAADIFRQRQTQEDEIEEEESDDKQETEESSEDEPLTTPSPVVITTQTHPLLRNKPTPYFHAKRLEPRLDKRFLLRRDQGAEIKYELTQAAALGQERIFNMLQFKDEETGEMQQGVDYFAWMPSASSNHPGRPPKGFFMYISDPDKVPVDHRLFEDDRFCWGTRCFAVPHEWTNNAGKTFYQLIDREKALVRSTLERICAEEKNLNHSSAFMGIYASNRRDNGWMAQAWIVVQCNDLETSREFASTLKHAFDLSKETKNAQTLLKKGHDDTHKETLERIASRKQRGQNNWSRCFGTRSKYPIASQAAKKFRRDIAVTFLNELGFSHVTRGFISERSIPFSAETVQNVVRYIDKKRTWAFYSGCTCIYKETRCVILHERPRYGIILLTGQPSSKHPLGSVWERDAQVANLYGAFPCSTGRTKPFQDTLPEEKIVTSSAFFCGTNKTFPRLHSSLYRVRGAEWINMEHILSRPSSGSEIHLKPLLIRCAPQKEQTFGRLAGLLT